MRLKTANNRRRRIEARKSMYEWVTWKNGKEYRTYKRKRYRKSNDIKCNNCHSVYHKAWIEPDGLCPLCH